MVGAPSILGEFGCLKILGNITLRFYKKLHALAHFNCLKAGIWKWLFWIMYSASGAIFSHYNYLKKKLFPYSENVKEGGGRAASEA